MFCPQCGANNRDAASFCRQCGEAIAARAGEGAPRSGRLLLFALGAAVAIGAVIVFVVATTGDDEGSSAPATAQESPTPAAASPAASSPAATAAPPTESPSPGATEPVPEDDEPETALFGPPDPSDFEDIEIEEPADQGEALLGGTPNYRAAEALAEIFRANGGALAGIEIWVWPVGGSDESLLVFEIDEAEAGDLPGDDEGDAFSQALAMVIQAPEIEEANVTRLAINYYAVDDEGAYTLTITLPLSVLQAQLEGTLAEDELFSQLAAQLKRESP